MVKNHLAIGTLLAQTRPLSSSNEKLLALIRLLLLWVIIDVLVLERTFKLTGFLYPSHALRKFKLYTL